MSDVDYEIADLFQGRITKISARHYTGKEEVLGFKYKRYVDNILNKYFNL